MPDQGNVSNDEQQRTLGVDTFVFTVCFAAGLLFFSIGILIEQQLGVNDTGLGLLIATRVLPDPLTWTASYPIFLLAALFMGLAMGPFPPGITSVASWFPARRPGTRLRYLLRRQRGLGGDQPAHTDGDGGVRLDGGRVYLVCGPGAGDSDLLPVQQRRTLVRGTTQVGCQIDAIPQTDRIAEESSNGAILAVLLFRARWLHDAGVVVAPRPDRCLRARHNDDGHGRRLL